MAPPSAAQTTTRPVVDQNEQAIKVEKDTLSTWKPERRICGNAPSSMLFVDDLNPSITADALNKIFANYGEVKSIRMASDKIILAPNFAYVEFSNIESARKAYEDTEGPLRRNSPSQR